MSRLALASTRAALVACVVLSTSAAAQNPEDEWGAFPGSEPADELWLPEPRLPPPPPPPRQPLVPGGERAAPAEPPRSTVRPRPPEEPNHVSMFGAPLLGQWKRGQSFSLGFPLVSLRASLGLSSLLDAGVGFDSFYGTMNEVRVRLKLGGLRLDAWSFALSLEGGAAFFTQRARAEQRGARWLTGRRNFNASPALEASYQGPHPRAARLFLELRYNLAFDTEPYATNPLEGVPPALVLGHNVLAQIGAELPLSAKTSFLFLVGLDFHGRAVDSVVMPACSVGLVTGL